MLFLSVAYYVLTPAIATIAGISLYMYFKDHNPPHFHAREDGDEEVFDLDGNSMKGSISPKKRKKVRKWAKENKSFLEDQWDNHQK